MQMRLVVLITSAIAVLGALVLMFIQVREPPSSEISADELEAARLRHERAARRAEPPPPAQPPTPPRSQTKKASKPETSPSARTPRNETETRPAPVRDHPRPSVPTPDLPDETGDELATPDGVTESAVKTMFMQRKFEESLTNGKKLLEQAPGDVKLLRVVVSAACVMGEEADARLYYAELPTRDQRDMRKRCTRYGLTLGDDIE